MNRHHKTKEEILAEHMDVRAAQRDSSCFSVLYDRYFRVIYAFVYRRVNNDADISGDVTSGVFLKAMLGLRKYRPSKVPFSAWLFRIALNEIKLHHRKTNRVQQVALTENMAVAMMREVEEDDESLETRQALLSALEKLDDLESTILEMRFFEEMSFREIGEVIGLKEAAAKVKTYRILDKLKNCITLNKKHG
ncbi:MAG: sigma-70 family RNA polymerase sigma factor [Flavobacteriales bacterium]|nr:sigma-70 family RNA polymerase sigma factor [Flavobacteriales bacterium]